MKKKLILFLFLSIILLIVSIFENSWRSFIIIIGYCLLIPQVVFNTRENILKCTFIGSVIFTQIRLIIGVTGYFFEHKFSFNLLLNMLFISYIIISLISISLCFCGEIILYLRHKKDSLINRE